MGEKSLGALLELGCLGDLVFDFIPFLCLLSSQQGVSQVEDGEGCIPGNAGAHCFDNFILGSRMVFTFSAPGTIIQAIINLEEYRIDWTEVKYYGCTCTFE